MEFLHSMIRVKNVEESLDFYCNKLGLKEVNRYDVEAGRFTLIFLEAQENSAQIELTYNWDNSEDYTTGRNFGHLAFSVDNIYQKCEELQKAGVEILRPPRDGHMAFIKSPDNISIELLQKGNRLEPQEPWASMSNTGSW